MCIKKDNKKSLLYKHLWVQVKLYLIIYEININILFM